MCSTKMTTTEEDSSIFRLPEEIITMILSVESITCNDVFNFGLSCKRLNVLVRSNQTVWKKKAFSILPYYVAKSIQQYNDGDWLSDLRTYCELKSYILNMLSNMSEKYFWREQEVHLGDMATFMEVLFTKRETFYYALSIYAELIKKWSEYPMARHPVKPYTLTEVHYASLHLKHLFQTYLMVKWHQMSTLNIALPESVMHLYLQWMDNTEIVQEDFHLIDQWAQRVRILLGDSHPLKSVSRLMRKQWATNFLENNMWRPNECREILDAIAKVLYVNMIIFPDTTLCTLKLNKIYNGRACSAPSVVILFNAIARRCGVKCVLLADSQRLILEWRENYATNEGPFYIMDNKTGKFNLWDDRPDLSLMYRPEGVIDCLRTAYKYGVRRVPHWTIRNQDTLSEYFDLGTSQLLRECNYYRIHQELKEKIRIESPVIQIPLNLKHIDPVHGKTIMDIVYSCTYPKSIYRPLKPKTHVTKVRYAVGMIVQHVRLNYVGVVTAWDSTYEPDDEWKASMTTFFSELEQPFYSILSTDCSKTYVPQEFVTHVQFPTRLYHLENILGRDFTHYDGFCYVPNEQKVQEYPNDYIIRMMIRNFTEIKRNVML